nr:MAG TPA: hypothetical protein [Caudoviricetes sp.]
MFVIYLDNILNCKQICHNSLNCLLMYITL